MTPQTSVLVADTLGELGLWFSLARSALVAGSLVAGVGGHNPLEPARQSCPFVSGPHVENWTTIYAALALEAAGFAAAGEGWKLALDGTLKPGGKLPILTLGGCKARGNPLGAAGMYQIVEAALQLRGQAGPGQLVNPRRALVQTLGGPASTAVTHVLERWN